LKTTVTVLGAGFQGICVALALLKKGYQVRLIDKADACMQRASLRNEGKVHLGFVYANDPTFRTASLMLESALHFAPIIEELVQRDIRWNELLSNPFVYAILGESMLSPQRLEAHYQKLQQAYSVLLAENEDLHYLGQRPALLYQPHNKNHELDKIRAEVFFQTQELALDLPAFRNILTNKLATYSSQLQQCYGQEVKTVQKTSFGFDVCTRNHEGTTSVYHSDLLVNCLWENRLWVDKMLGFGVVRPWIYRLKYRLLGEFIKPVSVPSTTFVLGPFGDVVTYPNGRVYLSWYPACMQHTSHDLAPPEAWAASCRGEVSVAKQQSLLRQVTEEFGAIVDIFDLIKIDTIDAGIIFSWGDADIHQPKSELHRRHEIGIHAHEGYFSIDTGKFTSAPFFAKQLLHIL
jgi:FAD dependent oxidoreductase